MGRGEAEGRESSGRRKKLIGEDFLLDIAEWCFRVVQPIHTKTEEKYTSVSRFTPCWPGPAEWTHAALYCCTLWSGTCFIGYRPQLAGRYFCVLNYQCEGRTKYKQGKATHNSPTAKELPLMRKSQLQRKGERRVAEKKSKPEKNVIGQGCSCTGPCRCATPSKRELTMGPCCQTDCALLLWSVQLIASLAFIT